MTKVDIFAVCVNEALSLIILPCRLKRGLSDCSRQACFAV